MQVSGLGRTPALVPVFVSLRKANGAATDAGLERPEGW
jgi:hypothetical protein